MTATIIYVLLGAPYDFEQAEPDPPDRQPEVAPLTYRESLGSAFGDAGPIRGDVEELIRRLHHAAHDDNTPDELSKRLTGHAKDGHRLFYGADDEPRELPPEPPTVYGWTIGAANLLSQVDPPTGAAREAVSPLADDPTPNGLRDTLNFALDTGDTQPDLPQDEATPVPLGPIESAADDPALIDHRWKRIAASVNDLLTSPGDAAAIATWAAVLCSSGVGLAPSWVLGVLVVLLQLVTRKPTPSDE